MNLETREEIVNFLNNNQRTRYASFASFVLLLFDYAITVVPEVSLVWFKPWTWSKVLFLWNRYGTFVILLFDTIVVLGGGPTDTLFALAKVPGLDRYLQDKRIVYPVVFLFFVQAIGMAAIIGMSFAKMKATHEPVPGFHICALLGVPQGMYVYWATNLAFESILFGLAVVKAYQHVSRRQGWSGPRILSVLVRDSILYFLVIFVTYIMNLVSWSTGGSGIYQLAIALAIALRASMGSRLLLNVREAYYGHDVILDNMLSTIQWQARNTDCVAMDSFHVANRHPTSTTITTLPELERDWPPEELLPGPSTTTSPSQTKSRTRVTFEPPYTP
ncbi:transmembrane protein, putative [Rhizoctonia solani AG-3 Rhs1AP]|uniref:Transmembrane protein, putative n=2 Tax=Rhizoctonia solani AG-3 TaxID=1086053 RepID=X8JEL5_9AGAM|nr:transmembrane protein, putative [Rhizoctonia solani AG-3 Rhs1AP]KEP48170.1 putative transmembrane protein [Rhizoctonia solani 123E]